MPDSARVIRPHPGAQRAFLRTSADIALYGGSAGSGKSFVVLLEAARHHLNQHFRAVYFRRTSADLRKAKGLWDTSHQIYPHIGGVARDVHLEWRFPSGAWLKMNHLERESDAYDHQGAEYPLIVFDETTHFSSAQFWYLFSRNRAPKEARVRPYVRGTCNPDPDSFVMTELLDPAGYIDEEGFARPEMAGVLMWFARDVDERLVWGRSPAEVAATAPHLFTKMAPEVLCRSFTFIPARLTDNPSMGEDYKAQLMALPRVERMRLLEGNWRARETAGTVFREAWFVIIDDAPPKGLRRVRYWDLAGSKRRRSDFTAGCKSVRLPNKDIVVEDMVSQKLRPGETEALIKRTAEDDGKDVEVWIEEERGAAGAMLVSHFARNVLPGFVVRGSSVMEGDKLTRAKPASSAAEQGRIKLRRGAWNARFLGQAQAFPDGAHDDEVDAFVGSFNRLQEGEFSWVTVRR
jgi:predicted phage terminase large subunit-like protein